jgi:Putative adhesin
MPSPALRALAPTCVVLAAVVSAACVNVDSQGHTVREEHRFKLTGQPDVRLTTFDGSIEIRSWDQPEVLVEVEKRGPTKEALERLEVKVSQRENRIELEARQPLGRDRFMGIGIHVSPHVRFIATVPRKVAIVARSGDGSIRVERVAGRIELRTGDGSIRGDEVSGELTLDTGDGSIVLDRVDGSVEVSTGDGGVSVGGKLAAARVNTGDGSVTLRVEEGSAMSSDWSVTTNDGGVVLYLPANFDADVDAHTGDGRIRSEFTFSDETREDERRSIRGRLGRGGHTLKVRTGDGSISIRTGA